MAGNLKHCIILLQDNDENIKIEAQKILLKLCNNILTNPEELHYRKINISNDIVSNKLLPAIGAIECLFEAGFVESDDGFMLPINASLSGVQELRSLLINSLHQESHQPLQTARNTQKVPTPVKKVTNERKYVSKSFLEELEINFRNVQRYENKNLQDKVKLILPLEKLQFSAMKDLREIQRDMKIKNTKNDTVIEDLILSELLYWFKFKFFKWVDSPACNTCMNECTYDRSIDSTNPQISRIEIHKCKHCGNENQFPRYTDPECLLYTRKGRCGEWANCFTLICRTVGFDARIVYDKTDHVWTEVWSDAHNRWIHADACENVMDRPLLYEKGWGKKLSYIIAISRDGIQDVTWRYTRKFDDVMKRRKFCSEEQLALFINRLNTTHRYSDGYSAARRKFVIKRDALELAEMLLAPLGHMKPSELEENESDYSGRTSGSLAWRTSRGEGGNSKYAPVQWIIHSGITNFELCYSILTDTYIIKNITNNKILKTKPKWQNGIEFMEGGVFRKEEQDWQMVYLARSPGSKTGKITWTFVVEDSANMSVDSIKIEAKTATFNGASVKWEIEGIVCSDDKTKNENKVILTSDCENFETKDLKGAIKISVSVTLSGGEGDTAWQHAQLFRQSLKENAEEFSMIIKIDLANKFLT